MVLTRVFLFISSLLVVDAMVRVPGLKVFLNWTIPLPHKDMHPCNQLLLRLQILLLQGRYRDENSEDMSEFARTNTVKRVMQVSIIKDSVVILVEERRSLLITIYCGFHNAKITKRFLFCSLFRNNMSARELDCEKEFQDL